jgi:hypothetical protein
VRVPQRSHWKEKKLSSWSFFCPLCRVTRRLPYQPRLSSIHFLQVGLTAAVITLLTWKWFDWKGIVSFVPLWIGFEVSFRSRLRADFHCPNCGFDLYLTDIHRAKQEIENHWKQKKPANAPLTEEAQQS